MLAMQLDFHAVTIAYHFNTFPQTFVLLATEFYYRRHSHRYCPWSSLNFLMTE